MPVEPQHTPKCLKPEWIGHPSQHFARAVLLDDVGEDFAGEEHHAREQPCRGLAAVQGKRGVAGSPHRGGTRDLSEDIDRFYATLWALLSRRTPCSRRERGPAIRR